MNTILELRKLVMIFVNGILFLAFCFYAWFAFADWAAMNARVKEMNAGGPLVAGYVMDSEKLFDMCKWTITDDKKIYEWSTDTLNCAKKHPAMLKAPRTDWEKHKVYGYRDMLENDPILRLKNMGVAFMWLIIMAYASTGIFRLIVPESLNILSYAAYAIAMVLFLPLGVSMWNHDHYRVYTQTDEGLWIYDNNVVSYQRVLIDTKNDKMYYWSDYGPSVNNSKTIATPYRTKPSAFNIK